MSGNTFEESNGQTETELFLAESRRNLEQLRNGIVGTFEYKNRSRDGKYYVFSYNTTVGEEIHDIKRKYISQYGGNIEGLLLTDATGKVLDSANFKGGEKVYLKVKMDSHPHPIEFRRLKKTTLGMQNICIINVPGWNPASIRQIYQDEFDVVIEEDRFIITDKDGNVYDDNHKFNQGDSIYITIKDESKSDYSLRDSTGSNPEENPNRIRENGEKNMESRFKEMIDKQKGPLTHGNRNNPEISLTFDDGYGKDNIKHILDTLRSSGIHATFFILGECLKITPDLRKQAIKEGHQVCCHTYSHIYLSDNSDTTDLTNRLNKGVNVNSWVNNVKNLLGNDYYENLKSKSGGDFPNKIKSNLLLETEILMREEQIKKMLGDEYLQNLKQNYPFFRFPGGCGARNTENIAVLKKLGYLSIGWSNDFCDKQRKHLSVDTMKTMDIPNGDIPLFHFKKDDYQYLDAYIENIKKREKSSKRVSDIIQ